uniref:Fungal lipase-type domain-containing protein n=1 Tax=Kalanchoe fedtschenkoi TaxID=63787 RepID=A0A7N0TQP4_KALFE
MADEESNCEDFCKDYMILNPQKAGIFDVFRLLCYKNIEERSFVDCSEEAKVVDFERRWLIFISVWVQKALFLGRRLLACIGCVVDTWLNLLSLNGGLIKLVYKSLTGSAEWPNRYSPNYTSLVGNFDPRRDLDLKIKPGDPGYNSELSIMAAKVAYENEAYIENTVKQHWKMAYLGYYKFYNAYMNDYKTRAFICHDQSTNQDLILVSFKGTSPFSALEWITDFDISWYQFEGVGKVHAGFMKALGLQKRGGWPKDIPEGAPPYAYYTLREKLRELLGEHKEAKFAVTGHSLGAALAILFVAVLMFHEEEELLARLEGVYTFGQPRVGDGQFGEYMTRKLEEFDVRYRRYVYCNDMVARLPFDDKALMYKHFGPCFYFNSCYKEKVLREEPDKNYFSLWWHIPKMLNACWELVRGFILPFRYGPEYRENWVMTLARVIGLMLPGLTDHIPRDYVNSTRLDHGRDYQTGPKLA